MVKVRLWQVDCSDSEPVEARQSRVLEALPEVARGFDFVVLPELWTVGAFNLAAIRDHHAPDGLVQRLGVLAAEAGVWLHAGSLPLGEVDAEGRAHNTALLFNPEGRLVSAYRKRHLFGFADGERTVIAPGDELSVVDTPLGRTGLATCYDLRFPELFRDLLDLGAETFLLSAGWPTPRYQHWWVLTQARAIENQALTIACNARGVNGDVVLAGGSMIVDAKGQVIVQGGPDDEFVDAEVDPSLAAQWRSEFPILADRRNE